MLTRLAAIAAGLMLMLAPAAAQEKIKFTLDWKLQGIHAWYYWAADKGYFKAEGLDVIIDQGEGSAATVTRIMGGAYDAGFGDMNAVIQNAAMLCSPGTPTFIPQRLAMNVSGRTITLIEVSTLRTSFTRCESTDSLVSSSASTTSL